MTRRMRIHMSTQAASSNATGIANGIQIHPRDMLSSCSTSESKPFHLLLESSLGSFKDLIPRRFKAILSGLAITTICLMLRRVKAMLSDPVHLSPWEMFTSAVILFLLYLITLALKRLYFHPLSKFPGPRLAAISRWYEFYYDVIKDGKFVKQFPRLHKKYGPIVRIAPNFLHVNDPEFYREVVLSKDEFKKDPAFYSNLGISNSLISMIDSRRHEIYRDVLAPIFSKRRIEELGILVTKITEKGTDIIKRCSKEGRHVEIQLMYRCITTDLIQKATMGRMQNVMRYMEGPQDEIPPFLSSFDAFSNQIHLMRLFPVLQRLALMLPPSVGKMIAPGYLDFRSECENWIKRVIARRQKGIFAEEDGSFTIFDLLLEAKPGKHYQVPEMEQLIDEAFLFLAAGVDTTAYTLSVATYYLLSEKHILEKLRLELEGVPRDLNGNFNGRHLLNLPYLMAVIKETGRIASSVPSQLPRVVPPSGCYVQGQFIPGGTSVAVTIPTVLRNPTLFPSPEKFIPERWLGERGKELEKWNVVFSKGSRQCIGMSLAYLEMALILAMFFSRFSMELYETDASSMEWIDHGQAKNRSYVKVMAKPLEG